MAQASQVKLYRSFVRGLMTEAGYLTYPEDTSSDELNTIPTRKGNRTRRFGIDYESDYQLKSIVTSTDDVFTEFVWKAAANESTVNFLCQQVGTLVYFFSLEQDPISDSLKGFTIDLAAYAAPNASVSDIQQNNAEFASGKGYLFVVHPHMEPISVEYDKTTDTINVTRVLIQIRDFEGLQDGLANDSEPSTLSKEHHYNLMNQGWGQPSSQVVPGGVPVDGPPIYYDPGSGGYFPYSGDGPIP